MKIAVIGCGWLGLPLAKCLFASGHEVHGSTTQISKLPLLSNSGIRGFIYDGVIHAQLHANVVDSDVAILNFPPSRSADYASQVMNLVSQFSSQTKLIFTSSTGVYQDLEGLCTEMSPIIASHPVFLAEQEVRFSGKKQTIIRLAGLISEDRNPVKYLAGKQNSDGQRVVNLVHRDDVIAAIFSILNHQVWDETFNVCFPQHPTRADYYVEQAINSQLSPPTFTISEGSGKEIDASKLIQRFNFTFNNSI